MRFNGKGARENGANDRELADGDPSAPDFGPRLAAAVVDLAAFGPHLVACSGVGSGPGPASGRPKKNGRSGHNVGPLPPSHQERSRLKGDDHA